MTFVEALQKARPLIADGRSEYICHALAAVCGERYSVTHRRRIGILLDGASTYAEWVRRNHPKTYRQMFDILDAFRDGRLQWIDYMIEQEAK